MQEKKSSQNTFICCFSNYTFFRKKRLSTNGEFNFSSGRVKTHF